MSPVNEAFKHPACTGISLSSSCLMCLHDCMLQKLEALVINHTRVRKPAAERLQAVLPNLQLLEC